MQELNSLLDHPFMKENLWWLLILIGLLFGYLISYIVSVFKVNKLKQELLLQEQKQESQETALAFAQQQLSNVFNDMSNKALQQNNEQFLRLAEENLKKHQQYSKSELEKREQSIQSLINPIRETLSKTDVHIREIEKERKQAYGSLKEQLINVAETQASLHQETNNLVNALRRPEVRGQWGEMTLKRLAELAGMVEHCDFYEQESVNTESGQLRPDMIVRMPDNRELIVDAKTPLDAYLSAIKATDATTRDMELQRHARKVKDRVQELASKAYWSQFKQSPDYVVLFIPGEQFLSSALEYDSSLLEYSLSNKVILATPTSLVALLRAVAFGWRQQVVAQNSEKIQQLGEDLFGRIATFTEHMTKMGSSIDKSVEHYNKALGSLERNVLSAARKFSDMGIEHKKSISESKTIESSPRKPSN